MSRAENPSYVSPDLPSARAGSDAERLFAAEGQVRSLWRRLAPYLGGVFALVLFAGALYLLHYKVAAYDVADVRRALGLLSWQQILAALAVSGASYALFGVYDLLALRHIGKRLPYSRVALASYTSYAFVHNFGFGSLLHAAIRYRLYGPLGLRTGEIAEVTAFVNVTFMIGLGIVLPAIAIVDAPALEGLGLPTSASLSFAAAALALAIAYAALGWWIKRPLKVFGYGLKVPSPATSMAQVGLSLADLALAGAVLFLSMPNFTSVGYLHVLAVFVVALTAGIISHVPGGVGVFDTIVLVGLEEHLPGDSILAGLLVFRICYFLVPLLGAGAVFGIMEAMLARRRIGRASQSVGAWIAPGAPFILAGCAFLCGALLLFSNATPETSTQLRALYSILPLHVVEASHFLGSVVGLLLLLIAARLQRRSHTAWIVTLLLLLVGSVSALFKGLAWAQAGFLLFFFLVLLAARDEFYIRSSLVANRFTPGWFVAIGVVLGSAFWLGLFSHKHIQYGNQLWWEFALHGDASRFLRASVAIAVVGLIAAARQLLGAARTGYGVPDEEARSLAADIVDASPEARANLALVGDKALLLHPASDSFLMYRVSRRSWVAFGDPIGPPERWRDLFVRLDSLATAHQGWPVFFGISEAGAQICRKLGFATRKIGEAAVVPLEAFSLEMLDAGLNETKHRMQQRGYSFKIIDGDAVLPLMPKLRAVAEEWAATRKRVRPGAPPPGALNLEHFRRFAVAAIQSGDRIVGFAALMSSAGKAELSIELMRHVASAPPRILDFLVLETALWAQRQGYQTVNLGTAPLRGLNRRHARSRWNSLGTHIFLHGEHFQNFAELRRSKERFHPRWEPRFVSSRAGLPLARALPDIARLIVGNFRVPTAR
jgi:phosphatidylglycerol lysyltransferase